MELSTWGWETAAGPKQTVEGRMAGRDCVCQGVVEFRAQGLRVPARHPSFPVCVGPAAVSRPHLLYSICRSS